MQTAQLLVLDTRFLGVRVRPGAPFRGQKKEVLVDVRMPYEFWVTIPSLYYYDKTRKEKGKNP